MRFETICKQINFRYYRYLGAKFDGTKTGKFAKEINQEKIDKRIWMKGKIAWALRCATKSRSLPWVSFLGLVTNKPLMKIDQKTKVT